MYVPTVGMNCDTMPTQRPSASEYGTPRAKQERPRDERGHDRLDAARVQVAAGLVDRDLPRVEHDLLSSAWKPRADGSSHARAVGGHVEREDEHGDEVEQPPAHGERDTDRARHDRRRCRR